MNRKILFKFFLFFTGLIAILHFLTIIFTQKEYPKDLNVNKLISPYILCEKQDGFYSEEKNSLDVIFLGSSNVHYNINPNVIWKHYGISSYDFTSDQQDLGTTYYYLKQVFKTQSPKVVMIDVLNSGSEETINNVSAHFAFDHMKNDLIKIQAIWNRTKKDRLEMYFPFITYHERWKSLNKNDFLYRPYTHNILKGSFVFMDHTEYSKPQIPNDIPMDTLSPRTIYWLDSIRKICKENNCECIFIKTPLAYYSEYYYYIEAINDYCKQNDVPFLYLNKNVDEIGLDFQTDFADGIHLNWSGQEKFSIYIGKYLSDNYKFINKRGMSGFEQWDEDYESMMYYIENFWELYNEKQN